MEPTLTSTKRAANDLPHEQLQLVEMLSWQNIGELLEERKI